MANVFNIAREYGRTLGGRWKRLGDYSGEEFFETKLEPLFLEARRQNRAVTIELDGTTGYPSSFLDQSFGELARRYGKDDVRRFVNLKGKVFGWVADYINQELWS
ncbi:MAG: STAS-like domain-containing protein [Bacteroides sp.]|nr:STAS-like domain-containing protein [Bacteroides sp.]